MTAVDLLGAYIEKAQSIGTFVELISPEALGDRLRSFWESLAVQSLDRSVSAAGKAIECDRSSASDAEDDPLAAIPAKGWPLGLKEEVETALAAAGCRIVSPDPVIGGYHWSRGMLAKARLGVSYCTTFLAETGSLVAPSGPGMGTLATLLPPVHLALSHPEGCRSNLADHLFDLAGSLPSRLTLITGPSRTGDIEASMTKGVHGPREVHHWIVAERRT